MKIIHEREVRVTQSFLSQLLCNDIQPQRKSLFEEKDLTVHIAQNQKNLSLKRKTMETIRVLTAGWGESTCRLGFFELVVTERLDSPCARSSSTRHLA